VGRLLGHCTSTGAPQLAQWGAVGVSLPQATHMIFSFIPQEEQTFQFSSMAGGIWGTAYERGQHFRNGDKTVHLRELAAHSAHRLFYRWPPASLLRQR
jgi:hypothetical protein